MIHGAGPREVRLARLRHGAPRSSPRSVAGELTVSPFSAPIARQFIGRRLASALFRVLDVVTVSGCFSWPSSASERTRAAHPSLRYSRFPPRVRVIGRARSSHRYRYLRPRDVHRPRPGDRHVPCDRLGMRLQKSAVRSHRGHHRIGRQRRLLLHPRIVRGSAYMEGQPWPVAWGRSS